MSKVSKTLELLKVTLLKEDDSDLEDDEEGEPAPKELKGKARAVELIKPKPKVVLDIEGDVKIKNAPVQNV